MTVLPFDADLPVAVTPASPPTPPTGLSELTATGSKTITATPTGGMRSAAVTDDRDGGDKAAMCTSSTSGEGVTDLTPPSRPRVLGVDLSLVSTGISDGHTSSRLQPKKLDGLTRLRWICERIVNAALGHGADQRADLVIVEGPAYGQGANAGYHERAGLHWMLLDELDDHEIPVAIVPSTTLKKYATGVGGGPKAGKDMVLSACVRRFGWFTGGNDEADALWLAAMGADALGHPLVVMPDAHRQALAKVEWPGRAA